MSSFCLVSEDELTKEADSMGVAKKKYVQDLLEALTGGEEGRRGRRPGNEDVYSFYLTPDHSRLSYQKTCNDVSVRNIVCLMELLHF